MSQTTISETDEYQPIYPPTEAEEKERAQYVKRWKKSEDKLKEETEMKKFIENYNLLSLKVKEGTQHEYTSFLDRCDQLGIPPKASGIVWNRVIDGNIELGGYSLGDKFTIALAEGIKETF